MDFVIADFPRSLYMQYSCDILFLKQLLRDQFAPIGHIHKMEFHKIFVTEEEGKSYPGEVKYYQLFIQFSRLELTPEELTAFKCKIRTFVDYQYTDFTFYFQPFKNLAVDDVCLFHISSPSKNIKKFIESWDLAEATGKPLSECMEVFVKEQEKTFEPWLGKIVKFERAILKHEWQYIYVETLEDGTLERINLDEGQQYPYITCKGNPTYKM
jgi:hypothetical protein